MTENRHSSLREIAAELAVSHESIRTLLNDCLGMKRVAARPVPKYPNFISGVVASEGLPECSSSFVLLRPNLNSCIHLLTVVLDGKDVL